MKVYVLLVLILLGMVFVSAETKLIETGVNITYDRDNETISLKIDTEDEDLNVDLTNLTHYSHQLNLDFLRELNCSFAFDSETFFGKFDACYEMFNTSWNCCSQFQECKASNTKLSTEVNRVYLPKQAECALEVKELKDKEGQKWLWGIIGAILGMMGLKAMEKSKFARTPEDKLPRDAEPG